MSYQIVVRKINSLLPSLAGSQAIQQSGGGSSISLGSSLSQTTSEQIYEQVVTELDLGKLIAAVNAKPRKPRAPKSAKTP